MLLASISFAKSFKDKTTGLEFVFVPGGCFQMGCLKKDENCYFDEKPSRRVCVNGFWMSKEEVTVKAWRIFLKETGYKPEKRDLWGCVDVAQPQFEQSPNDPVVCVSWFDAKNFCEWLSKKLKRKVRLPTEAEWEFACKTAENHVFATGNKVSGDTANFWSGFGGKSGRDKFKFTSPACFFGSNELGICDLSGNVWEWTEDWYSLPGIPSPRLKKVIKGGGWESKAAYLRCSSRRGFSPERAYDTVGFRVVIEEKKR